MHHIISDNVSSSIFLDELNQYYNIIELEEMEFNFQIMQFIYQSKK